MYEHNIPPTRNKYKTFMYNNVETKKRLIDAVGYDDTVSSWIFALV